MATKLKSSGTHREPSASLFCRFLAYFRNLCDVLILAPLLIAESWSTPYHRRGLGRRTGRACSVSVLVPGGVMLHYALVFLVIALIAGALGVSGVASVATNIAYVLFVIAIVLFLLHVITGRRSIP